MFERAFTLYLIDPEQGQQTELVWPAGAPVPTAGDLFVWEGEHRWIDDVSWVWTRNMVGEARVTCTLTLGLDEEYEACPACGGQ